MRNDIVFLTIYYTLAITLSSFIIYKTKLHLYEQLNIPSNKLQWQTILAVFLLHLLMILIAFAIMPFYDSYGNTTKIAVIIGISLAVFLAVLYTIWYFIHHKLYAGLDFIIILDLTMYLNIPLHYMEISEELYFKAWLSASTITYLCFIIVVSIVLGTISFCVDSFPDTKERIMQLWNGGDSNEK